MLLNIAIWQDPGLFGDFGGAGRAITNPTIDTFFKPFGNEIAGLPALADLRDARADARRDRRDLLRDRRPRPCRGSRSGSGPRDRRGDDRLITPGGGRRRAERSARRLRMSGGDVKTLTGRRATRPRLRSATSSAASCATSSFAAMQRVSELAGRDLTLRPLSGGITNRNFLVEADGTADRWVIRLAGNDTHLLGISREVEHAATVAAAGVGVGPEVTAFIRPEGYLVTRFIAGGRRLRRGRPPPGDARPGGRIASPDPRRAADPGPVRPVPDRRGVSRPRGRPRRPDPGRVRPRPGGGSADRARVPRRIPSSSGPVTTTS